MYCIGLTGQIGSGKSTVADYFSKLGIDLISADQIAKQLTATRSPVLEQILYYFGPSFLTVEGNLDRRRLRERIFSNRGDRQWIEQLLHPLIREEIKQKIHNIQSPYAIIEIPLLTNRMDYPYLNRILLVEAAHQQKIKRIMNRDQSSEADVLAILNAQVTEEDYRAIADDKLDNSDTLDALKDQVNKLHQIYLYSALKTP